MALAQTATPRLACAASHWGRLFSANQGFLKRTLRNGQNWKFRRRASVHLFHAGLAWVRLFARLGRRARKPTQRDVPCGEAWKVSCRAAESTFMAALFVAFEYSKTLNTSNGKTVPRI